MRLQQKIAIIKRFLAENSVPPLGEELKDDEIERMPFFKDLSSCLDFLAGEDPVVNFSTIGQDINQWNRLTTLLKSGLTLRAGSPPGVEKVNYNAMRDSADHYAVSQLPQPDYYRRAPEPNQEAQKLLNNLILSCRDKLGNILMTYPEFAKLDTANNQYIQKCMEIIKGNIKIAEERKDEKSLSLFRTQLTLLEDIYKLNQLKIIQIPNESGSPLNYCTLAESAGGVTEKVSLISLSKATAQLKRLDNASPATVRDYLDHRNDYKLSTQAILKLPKHGKIEEVQREALALNFSRLCGLDTTSSSMVMHEGKPALFVPFDDIRLLNEFAHGKVFKSGFSDAKTYEHYSTIDPVGSGLQANVFIDDFGSSLGVFYLCSDPDFVGGYNQNKALRNGKSLFMFDMVVMPSDKLGLDSRLSLQPVEFLIKHTRHGQGRNRTLIEDSSFQEKFNSLMTLARNEKRMLAYLDLTLSKHAARIEELNKKLSEKPSSDEKRGIKAEIKQVTALKKDAEAIRLSVKSRIKKLFETLPGREQISNHGLAKGLILEKLLNNPALFTDKGKPYRNPWTYRNDIRVTHMTFVPGHNKIEDRVLITLSDRISPQRVNFLQRHGAKSLEVLPHRNEFERSHQVVISVTDLAALQENMLYPENHLDGLLDADYLNLDDLQAIGDAYGEGHRTRIVSLIQQYNELMRQTDMAPSIPAKLKAINTTDAELLEFINTAKDKGFGMHVRKKLQFDIQQQLRQMIPENELPAHLDEAFSAALKLDQVNTFNRVMETAIETKKWSSPEFKQFLQDCLTQYQGATNHDSAVDASHEVAKRGGETMNDLKQSLKAVLAPRHKGGKEVEENDELNEINPLEIQEEQLRAQREKFVKSVSIANNNTKGEGSEITTTPTIEVKL